MTRAASPASQPARAMIELFLEAYRLHLLRGLEGAQGLFDVVFFAVLVSAVTQGWTLPFAARVLGLREPSPPESGVTLEITSLQNVDGDIVEYPIWEGSRADGLRIRELALPDGVVVAMIVRGRQVIPPRGSTKLASGDVLHILVRQEAVRDVYPLMQRWRTGPIRREIAGDDEVWMTVPVHRRREGDYPLQHALVARAEVRRLAVTVGAEEPQVLEAPANDDRQQREEDAHADACLVPRPAGDR